MEIGQIVLLVLIFIALIYLIIYLFSKSTQLTRMAKGTKRQTIVAKTLKTNNNTSNYTYSTWLFVNDWNYRFGMEKVVLARADKSGSPNPAIVLGAMENTLNVKVNCYPQSGSGDHGRLHTCKLDNVPLQRWVNVIISVYGRTLDVYMDGKLVRTCVLPGVPKLNNNANIMITPNGGFDGWTTNFKFWPAATNPQDAYDIYKDGLGGSILGNLLNKFRLQVSFIRNNETSSSFQI